MEDFIRVRLSGAAGAGQYMVIDSLTFEAFGNRKFWLNSSGYPMTTHDGKVQRVHRVLMDAKPHEMVDHINGNRLDNRRSNLRLCTRQQNLQNTVGRGRKIAPYKGIKWDKGKQVWVARINADGKAHYLGGFDDPRLAAEVYDAAAIKYHKQFARTNFLSAPTPEAARIVAELEQPRWKITSPAGEVYLVDSVRAFCRDHELVQSSMNLVALGRQKHHKGWKCERLTGNPPRRRGIATKT